MTEINVTAPPNTAAPSPKTGEVLVWAQASGQTEGRLRFNNEDEAADFMREFYRNWFDDNPNKDRTTDGRRARPFMVRSCTIPTNHQQECSP
jgi:hypothetical protein